MRRRWRAIISSATVLAQSTDGIGFIEGGPRGSAFDRLPTGLRWATSLIFDGHEKGSRGGRKRMPLPATNFFMAGRKLSVLCKKRVRTVPIACWTVTGLEVERPMKSPVVKRSIVIAGHKTSVSLEDAFWKGLKEIADARDMTLSELVASIDSDRRHGNLSSAIRLFVLDHFRSQLTPSSSEHHDNPMPARVAS